MPVDKIPEFAQWIMRRAKSLMYQQWLVTDQRYASGIDAHLSAAIREYIETCDPPRKLRRMLQAELMKLELQANG